LPLIRTKTSSRCQRQREYDRRSIRRFLISAAKIAGGYGTPFPGSSQFGLTPPLSGQARELGNDWPVCCVVARHKVSPEATPLPARTVLSAAQRTTDGMVRLPGGEFAMGDDSGDGYAADGEGPVRRVRVDSFWIDACVVSNADFAAFSAASGYVTDAERLTGAARAYSPWRS
jgi:formylglycine-generating enzyme required for sulfatase activity